MPRPATRPSKKTTAAKTRVFLFSDLRDYTSFVETHGDAEGARLLRDYRDLVRREVARFAGAEIKTEGDSFYVVFESASGALDCAVSVLKKIAAQKDRDPARRLRVGIGLHAGETIAFDKQFVGSAVNVASRLASKAEAGEVLISDTLRGLVRTGRRYPLVERGALALKGVSEPIRAWSVSVVEEGAAPAMQLAPAPAPHAPAAGQILCPVIVGRESELAQAVTALDAALAGRGQTVVLAGEAGGGKSAFVREVEKHARERAFRVLTGATLESETALPYSPFIAAVRSGFRGIERERLGRVLAQTAPDLAQLFPELGRAAGRPDGPAQAEQHRLSIAFHGLFTAFAREAPILVVLEDLHWSDEASLDLLHYLSRELRDSRSLLLATYRSDEMHRRHPFLRTLANLQRERLVAEIALRRLTPDEVARLIQETFATPTPTTGEFRDAIYARSEGNPFFTEELLKSMVESGDIYHTETGWERKPIAQLRIPASLRDAVRLRVERASDAARVTLAAASVIGQRFPFELLCAVREVKEPELEAQLRELIELQLLAEIGGEDDVYGFRHALTREVIYDDRLVRERKRLHRAVAAALLGDARAAPSVIALHLIAAGDATSAVPHLLEAARRAAAADAPREAAEQYERALEIGVADEQLAATDEQLAETYHLFDYPKSLRAAEEAAARYRERADRRGLARMLRLASRCHYHLGNGERATALAREALAVLEGIGDVTERARVTAHLAQLRMTDGDRAEAIRLADAAIALGERLEDVWSVAQALITKGTSVSRDDVTRGLELLSRGRDLARDAGLHETASRGYNNMAVVLLDDGRPVDETLQLVREAMEHSHRHGLLSPALLGKFVTLLVQRGDWDEALAARGHAAEGTVWMGDLVRAEIDCSMGRDGPQAAAPLATRLLDIAIRSAESQVLITSYADDAWVHALLGDRGHVSECVSEIERLAAGRPDAGLYLGWAGIAGTHFASAAVLQGEASWLDRLESGVAGYGMSQIARAACAACREVLSNDGAGAGMARLERELGERGYQTDLAAIVVACLVAARQRGLALGSGWREPLERAREFSRRVGATWYLEQLGPAT